MTDNIVTKQCVKCKQIKEFINFNKNKTTPDGFAYYCKCCLRVYRKSPLFYPRQIKYRRTEKGKITRNQNARNYRKKNSQKIKARNAVNYEIKQKRLKHPTDFKCMYCPDNAKEYHHHLGYAKENWLDVVPVCFKCHKEHS
jgi:hypothetical protein